jgi:starch phosphorylase
LRLQIQLPGSRSGFAAGRCQWEETKLYLLDTNDFANTAAHRGITSQLYGGDAEMRLKQEIVLGIGGWRLLRALGLTPEVCHLNEGHAAFAVLERARSYMEDHKKPFDLAMNITRAGNVFTTHTAVSAGFDRFDPRLIRTYLSHYAVDELAISVDDLLAMGRQNPEDASEPFNMAYLAVRGSGQINGVSKLHGQVSRQIFQPLFPRWPQGGSPDRVGDQRHSCAHLGFSRSRCAVDLRLRRKRWRGDRPIEDDIRQISNQQLWQLRTAGRKA